MTGKIDRNYFSKLQEGKTSSQITPQSSNAKRTSSLAVASLILAVFCVLSFFAFVHSFVRLRPIYRPLGITSISFFVGSLMLAVVALVVIALKRRKLKGGLFAAIALLILGCLLGMLIPFETSLVRHRREVVGAKLARLYRAITEYSVSHDGYLPTADKWCDLLIEHDKNLSKDSFRYPPGKYGVFLFAFNKNLDGLRLSDIPEDVVLLFETDGSWNLSGGPELLEGRFKERKRFFVLLANGRVYQSIPSLRELFKEKNELRWKP